jgi:hypothetical protein
MNNKSFKSEHFHRHHSGNEAKGNEGGQFKTGSDSALPRERGALSGSPALEALASDAVKNQARMLEVALSDGVGAVLITGVADAVPPNVYTSLIQLPRHWTSIECDELAAKIHKIVNTDPSRTGKPAAAPTRRSVLRNGQKVQVQNGK